MRLSWATRGICDAVIMRCCLLPIKPYKFYRFCRAVGVASPEPFPVYFLLEFFGEETSGFAICLFGYAAYGYRFAFAFWTCSLPVATLAFAAARMVQNTNGHTLAALRAAGLPSACWACRPRRVHVAMCGRAVSASCRTPRVRPAAL